MGLPVPSCSRPHSGASGRVARAEARHWDTPTGRGAFPQAISSGQATHGAQAAGEPEGRGHRLADHTLRSGAWRSGLAFLPISATTRGVWLLIGHLFVEFWSWGLAAESTRSHGV